MADFKLEFDGDLSSLIKSVSKATAGIEKSFGGLTSTLSKSFSGLGAALGAIGVGFSLKAIIDEASEAEAAISGFNLVLKQTGVFSEQGSAAFSDFAEAIQRQTGVADEAVLNLAGTIQRFAGLSQRDLATVTQATIDFATFTGTDFDTASQAVGKALQGNEGALARYGIAVKSGKNETEQLANVLNGLAIAQGAAAAKSDTFAVQLNIIRGEFSTLFEELGGAIIKNKDLADSFKIIRGVLIDLTDSVKSNDSSLAKFVSGSVFFAIGAIQLFESILKGSLQVFRLLRIAIESIIKSFLDLARILLTLAKPIADVLGVGGIADSGIASLSSAVNSLEKDIGGVGVALSNTFKAPLFGEQATQARDLNKEIVNLKKNLGTQGGKAAGLRGQDAKLQAEKEKFDSSEQDARDKIIKTQIKEEADAQKKMFDQIGGVVGGIMQGAAGAAGAISGIAGVIGDSLLPGVGGLVSQVVSFLAQGPDLVKAQIKAFLGAIPGIIQNIILAVPALIIALVEAIPVLIDGLLAALPVVVNELVNSIPLVIQALVDLQPKVIDAFIANLPALISAFAFLMPRVATTLAIALAAQAPFIGLQMALGFVQNIPLIVQGIADGVKQALSQLTGGLSGGGGALGKIGGAVGGITKKLKFAEGGIVPGGAPFTDRVPAMLTPGEMVIPRDQVGGMGGGTTTVINKIYIGEKELAQSILSLNRQGFRTA